MRHIYADFVDKVAKPARYLGGEYMSVSKDWTTVEATVCLAFPDVYDIGMSHLGTKILYSLLNRDPTIACERVFTPWIDMEAELRERNLPLVSLESQRQLTEFDIVGFSLQYELTYTNVLTILDLGGLGIRAADRPADGPLILVGGPTASHAEPMAPFIDAAFIGEAENQLPQLARAWAALRREIRAGTRTRPDALAELASRFSLYVPSLYATVVDADTSMVVVGAPLDPRVPARVMRSMVENLDDYPFPSDAPVPYAEAVFERASVEISRGCTEGCRFCQAGMIYRPVRERSPESIADSLICGVEKAGYEESGLTSLSTADFSSITPLVKNLAAELRRRGVSMSVASLRAYGLNEDLLDELAQTRISGLTFAPEAGTQRMRDVVNKNVTEAHVAESTKRVFSRGWARLKLYFMIGLPTEQDEDVRGIVETGLRMLKVGRQYVGNRAEITVSVSSHVPKPHTPFQWAAQDSFEEIGRKQYILRRGSRDPGLRLKHHNSGVSWVEGLLARGDRRLADVVEQVWRAGARFDGWEEIFDLERWQHALADAGLTPEPYLGTRPISARLPWDHIDVGLEDGFLLSEYRKALKSRLSPPCGKVAGQLIHPTNVADSHAEKGKLVCYDCGVACDLQKMRADRLVALTTLGALEPVARRSLPVVVDALAEAGAEGLVDVSERGGGSPGEVGANKSLPAKAERNNDARRNSARGERVRLAGFIGSGPAYSTYRVRFAKVGRAAFLGHLDLGRLLARTLRRAGLALATTRGFSPKPRITFGPALGLGVPSLGELVDIDLEHGVWEGEVLMPSYVAVDGTERFEVPADEVKRRFGSVCPPGIEIESCEIVRLSGHASLGGHVGAPGLGKLLGAVDVLIRPCADGMKHDAARASRIVDRFMTQPLVMITRASGDGARPDRAIDVRAFVDEAGVIAGDAADALCRALDWPAGEALIWCRVRATAEGSAKPQELARAFGVWGPDDLRAEHALVARMGVVEVSAARPAAELVTRWQKPRHLMSAVERAAQPATPEA